MHKIRTFDFEKLSSTQDKARELLALEDTDSILWIRARQQTEGRGRQGRSWFSDNPNNLLITSAFLMPPHIPQSQRPLVSLLAGQSLMEELEAYALKLPVFLKWPNDVCVGDPLVVPTSVKKLAGILVESFQLKGAQAMLVGWGINTAEAPAQSPGIALPEITNDVSFYPDRFYENIQSRWSKNLGDWAADPQKFSGELIHKIKTHTMKKFWGTAGRTSSQQGNEWVRAVDLANDGSLIVENQKTAERKTVSAGEFAAFWQNPV